MQIRIRLNKEMKQTLWWYYNGVYKLSQSWCSMHKHKGHISCNTWWFSSALHVFFVMSHLAQTIKLQINSKVLIKRTCFPTCRTQLSSMHRGKYTILKSYTCGWKSMWGATLHWETESNGSFSSSWTCRCGAGSGWMVMDCVVYSETLYKHKLCHFQMLRCRPRLFLY